MLKTARRGALRSAIRRLGVKEGGVSALAIGASMLAPYALAQDSDGTETPPSAGQVEEIVVTGMREALKTAQEIKKEADTVVDSITASDIGAFPDKSVAEALQRVTGVFVTRFAAASDTTHFSAEPSGVVIRGLPQVRSEFNGRDSFNANSSRGLGFGDVSPELMAGVDTYKNLTADMIEGGIAGTVNLRTALPFDSDGFVAAFSAEADYGNLVEDFNPEGSALMSNRWNTGIGEIGVMVNGAYSEVTTASQGTQVGRYYRHDDVAAYGGGTKWVPGGIDIRETLYDRTRIGTALAAQWRSPDESLLATLQYNRSEYQNDFEEHSLTGVIGGSQAAQDLVLTSPVAVPAEGTPAYEFDSRGVFTRGVLNDAEGNWAGPINVPALQHPNGYQHFNTDTTPPDGAPADDPLATDVFPFLNWYCYAWATTPDSTPCPSTRGISLSADTRDARTKNVTEDLSLNLRWQATDRLAFNFDLQHIDATVDNFDNSANARTAADVLLDLTGGRPRFEFNRPTGYGFTEGGFADPRNYHHEWVMEHAEQSEGEEWAGRIDAEIDLSDGWMDSLRLGVRRAERDQQINWSTYNWGAVQPLWGVQNDEAFFLSQGAWSDTFETHDLGSDIVDGGVFGGGVFVHPRMDLINNYQNTIATFAGHSNSWVPLGQRTNCPVVEGTLFCPVEMQDVSEDIDAAYVMLRFGGDDTRLGPVSVRGNIGVRYVVTTVEASGGVAFPLFTSPGAPTPGQPIDPLALTPADDIAFMNGGTATQADGDEHENWLPSLNIRFGLTDDIFIRFAASRALARPDMGLYKNYIGISRVGPDCESGTVTYLEPGNCNSPAISYTPRYEGTAGNPRLEPTTADQLDLTWEWYFSDTGSVTAAVFYKKFKNYLTYGNYVREFTNNGVTRSVSINGPITGAGAELQGFEVAYQSFLDMLPSPWDGFGYQLNFTYVDNKGVTNSNLTSVSGSGGVEQDPLITFTNLPLEGYSKTAYNIVAMYDKGKFSARLAYNWREKYLVSQADCCIKLPIWQDDYGQLDGSVHFRPTESLDLYVEGQNLTNSETVLFQQVTNDGMLLPRSWFVNDRRFQIGLRYRIR